MKFIKVAFLFLVLIGIARFCHYQTAGFKLSKIQDNFCAHREWIAPPLEAGTKAILQGKFTYLGRGLQSFVFLSSDQKYVLKIFNNRYQRKIFWLQFLPGCRGKQLYHWQKLEKTFHSYEIAYQELQAQTGLLYAHLNPTDQLGSTAIVVDKLGIEHPLLLDRIAFLLQKKVDPLYAKLTAWKQQGEIEKAKRGIRALVQLLKDRFDKGIADHDPLLRTNFGFIDEQPFQIDVGAFAKEEPISDPKEELLRIVASLKDWIQHNYPELSECLDEEMR